MSVNGNTSGDSTNGTSLGTIYAPTTVGTSGNVLKSSGSGAPSWGTLSPSDVGMTVSNVAVTANLTNQTCNITGSGNSGKSQTIIYTNDTVNEYTVGISTSYKSPDGNAIELTVPAGGYAEVNFINVSGTIYARGV